MIAANHIIQGIAEAMPFFWPLMTVVLGLVFGSFLGCAIYRVPRKQSLWHPPSQCPHCHTRLTAPDLVPVLSWAVMRGRCRHCKGEVSGFYAFVEGLTAALFLAAYGLTGPQLAWLPLAAAVCCVVFATMVFYKNHTFTLKTAVFGLFFIFATVALWH